MSHTRWGPREAEGGRNGDSTAGLVWRFPSPAVTSSQAWDPRRSSSLFVLQRAGWLPGTPWVLGRRGRGRGQFPED